MRVSFDADFFYTDTSTGRLHGTGTGIPVLAPIQYTPHCMLYGSPTRPTEHGNTRTRLCGILQVILSTIANIKQTCLHNFGSFSS